jgi:hypothetical protein
MTRQFAIIGLTLLVGITSNGVMAQNLNGTTSNFVTTAVPFLRISPDARAGGMGDGGIAVDADPNAQYWNVAKLPFCDKNYGFSATYTPWLKDLVPDIFLAYLTGYGKFGKDGNQTISASMRYFSLGNINYTSSLGDPNGTGMPREYSFDLGYSRKLSEFLSSGVSLRYIHSAIASGVAYTPGSSEGSYSPGNALAADLGVYYVKKHEIDDVHSHTFSFGAVASNIGSKISYNSSNKDFIPMNLGLGAAYTSQLDQYNSLTVQVELDKLLVPVLDSINGSNDQVGVVSGIFKSFQTGDQLKEIDASLGLEWWYQKQFAVRAGYFYEDKTNGDRQYATCGIGIRYNVLEINASYLIPEGSGITRNPLSNTLRFSLIFAFDKIEKPAPEANSGNTPAQ